VQIAKNGDAIVCACTDPSTRSYCLDKKGPSGLYGAPMTSCLTVACLAWGAAAPNLKDSAPSELLGRWTCTARTHGGRAVDPDPCVWEFIVGGKLVKWLRDENRGERRYTVNATRGPLHLDWTEEEDPVEALFNVDGDTLTLCYSHDPNESRPTRFESPKGSRMMMLTFKRVKAKD
jgi:uncharacterized protein (TIGR03067 family)